MSLLGYVQVLPTRFFLQKIGQNYWTKPLDSFVTPIFEQIVNSGHNPLTYDITYAILCPQIKMIR